MKKQKDLEGNYHDDCDSDDWELHGCGPKCTLDGFCERHDGVHPKPKHGAPAPMSAANTPMPWKVWPENTPSITTDRTDAKTQSIARCVEPADAAFVVRAVNSFQSLVDSLQQIANLPNNEQAVKIAQSAIAKAEGK